MNEDFRHPWRWLAYALAALLLLAAFLLLLARTVDRDLNHDEHQFLAPAALLSREGLQPWRDYPLFHLPNLVFAYAAADRLSGDLILGAKMVCFAASAAVLLVLVVACFRLGRHGHRLGLFLAAAALLLLLGDPLFRYTTGKTWNHEVPTALLLGSIGCMAAAGTRDRLWLTAIAGVFGGLAVGCRLTFAPALVGLFAVTWLLQLPTRRRAAHAGMLTAAATLALSPSLYYLATQREAFVFGNFEFPRLRLLDPADTRAHETVVWWRKLRYFYKEIIRGSWIIFGLYTVFGLVSGWRWVRHRRLLDLPSGIVLVVLPFLLLGCFAPSRYQYQHYFVFIPVLVYGIVVSVRSQVLGLQHFTVFVCVAGGILGASRAVNDYPNLQVLADRDEWFSTKTAEVANRIRELTAPDARILTLAPALVVAGGLRIYPELATGAFSWRGAHHVQQPRRSQLHLIAPEDIAALLESKPPAAILTGVEEEAEEDALVTWAKEHRYRPVDLHKKRLLWVPPRR